MNKHSEIDNILRELYAHTPKEKAPEGMTQRIMQRIQFMEKPFKINYQPVINKKGWVVVGLVFSSIILTALFIPTDATINFGIFNWKIFSFNLPTFFNFRQMINLEFSLPDYLRYFTIILPLSLLLYYTIDKWMQKRLQQRREFNRLND